MKISCFVLAFSVFSAAFATPSLHNVLDENNRTPSLDSRDSRLDDYVVVLKDNVSPTEHLSTGSRLRKFKPHVRRVYRRGPLRGYAGRFEASEVDLLRENPDVAYIEKDITLRTVDVQSNATYNLAITSQGHRLGKQKMTNYYYNRSNKRAVTVYIVDTGLYTEHNQFEGRAILAKNFVEEEPNDDDNGHGTHVAGIVGARDYGVYKSAKLAGVKVLGINGTGSLSDVLAGIDWAVQDSNGTLSVINLSLGGDYSQALNDAVQGAVQRGMVVTVAAGNQGKNACTTSPSSAPDVIAVGAINNAYRRPSFSNFGKCVDIFAPGVDVISTFKGNPEQLAIATGTSMASPHIAGIAAYLIEGNTLSTPAEVYTLIMNLAQKDLVRAPKRSPNRIGNNGYFSS